jgi:nitrogenase molybdenum-iron protein alpha/beta subunit
MAVESISDAVAFLHGPGGCRVRHMIHSSAVFPRLDDPNEYDMSPFFCGYPRVPATYLDEYDYVNGAMYKVTEGLEYISGKKPALAVVINSPGAALIGDNHEKAIIESGIEHAVFMDESLVSMPFAQCYAHTLLTILKGLSPEVRERRKGTAILLGVTILDKDWNAAAEELSGYLEMMGLEVLCMPGAGASVEQLERSVEAEYAVVVCPEACDGLTDYYSSMGVKVIRSPSGAPVGLDALEAWARTVSGTAGLDCSAVCEKISKERTRIRDKFIGMKYNALRIKGMTFSAAGIGSVIRPLTEWLYSYLAMAPVAVNVDPGADPDEVEALKAFLEKADYADSFGREPIDGSGVVLCEGFTAETMRLAGQCSIGIPIGHSSMGLDDVIPRPIYGIQGVRYIMDELLHGVRGS